MNTISDSLRQAIRECGLPYRQIGIASGVNRQSIQRFADGLTGLSVEQLDALGLYFGLELQPAKTKRKG